MMLSRCKNENIVSLLGFCDDCEEKILVYEYVPNKSLDLYLNSDKLRWIRRLKICIGAARGLAYLHNEVGTQQRVLHRDIKSSNILLDEDWNAKISDFGLSKLGPANQEYTFLYSNPVGTHGYCDPLYAEAGFLTKESDVYSFGVVLFEVLCGRLCFENKDAGQPALIGLVRQSYENNTIEEIVYGSIKEEINPESLQVYAKIAYQCLKMKREERPLMSDVVWALETALSYQEPKSDQDANTYLPTKSPSEVTKPDPGKATHPIDIEEYASSEGGGLLVVTIHEGNDLKGKHPFVILRVGDDIKRTTNNQNPVWKETFKFTLEKPTKAILHLVVCSDARSKKDILGDVDISLADVVKEKQMNNMYNIGNGRIHVELQWERSDLPLKSKPKLLKFMNSVYNLAVS
ncbi:probable receptor-like protein kinase At5g38990 isoform X2 [Helianthus annuus]|uniref:probable receptor-like protein kinase At5g38990 isoform X2 n=1 Tax=Helianthus annuus TaxID=4232 RepID=UPI000B8F9709|nr:probable receptor-like protein kinase At5g38990 isoform X2 [Helianthus annuus]